MKRVLSDELKFKSLLDEIGIKYASYVRGHVTFTEIQILPENLYADWRGAGCNSVSIVFDKDGKFLYFEGASCK